MPSLLDQREQQLRARTTPLPGSVPYDNIRPLNVPQKWDGERLIDFLESVNVRLDRQFWRRECLRGRITYRGRGLGEKVRVRAGWQLQHHTPETTEPDVANGVVFLYEDDVMIAIDKPAPLPMHPCGRFNRNTLQYFLQQVYAPETIRIAHRLDAETTGVVLLARTRAAASCFTRQFSEGRVKKVYLARVMGYPAQTEFECKAPISIGPAHDQGTRAIDEQGLPSHTRFEVVGHEPDGTSTLRCFPVTGRTNQIRIHLAHLGHPIVGDHKYGATNCYALGEGRASAKRGDVLERGRLWLHALQLTVQHPVTGTSMTIRSKRGIGEART